MATSVRSSSSSGDTVVVEAVDDLLDELRDSEACGHQTRDGLRGHRRGGHHV
jgi:hypothetical protein